MLKAVMGSELSMRQGAEGCRVWTWWDRAFRGPKCCGTGWGCGPVGDTRPVHALIGTRTHRWKQIEPGGSCRASSEQEDVARRVPTS